MNDNNNERKHFRPTIIVNSTKEISIKKAASMLKNFLEEHEKLSHDTARESSKEEQYQLPDTLKSNSKILFQMMSKTSDLTDSNNDDSVGGGDIEQMKKKEVVSKKRKKLT